MFNVVAGVRYEARQTERAREAALVPLAFTTRGTALVPVVVGTGVAEI